LKDSLLAIVDSGAVFGKVIRWFGTRHGDEYKKGSQWFGGLLRRKERYDTVAKWSVWILYLGILAAPIGGLIIAGVGLAGLVFGATPDAVLDQLRRRASPGLRSYWQALNKYDDDKRAAEAAARRIERQARTTPNCGNARTGPSSMATGLNERRRKSSTSTGSTRKLRQDPAMAASISK
jgi:hypothetical protein